jgi:GNAT superfamily N-acetyltransferase
MQEAVIAAATRADIDDLVVLMDAFYRESSYLLDPVWAARSFEHLLANPSLGSIWIARIDAEAVGHAVLTVRYAMEHRALAGCIDDLYVAPSHRRRHVATRLLGAFLDECRRRACAAVTVEVAASNPAALDLYRRFGLAPPAGDRLLFAADLLARSTG